MEVTDKITITNEDNMALMARYPDKYFDLAIVDPPYGIDIAKWDSITNRPKKEYFEELFRVSKNQIIWGGNYFTDKLIVTESWLCWYKKPFLKQQSHFELAWTSLKIKPKLIEYTYAGNCEGLTNLKVNYEKKAIHPTQKPENLYSILLQDYAKQGDKILDTHLGSGSIAIACHDYGFELTACELDAEYYEKAIQRIKNHTNQQKLF
jgi:site-specific DNA-methyltransferase (adenine-specific)